MPAADRRSPPPAAGTSCPACWVRCWRRDCRAKTALRYAVCLHGATADALVAQGIGPLGLTASELPDAARALLNQRGTRPR